MQAQRLQPRAFRPAVAAPRCLRGALHRPTGGLQARAASQPTWNPVEVVKREQGLQSNRLPAPVREAVSSAVEELRFRVTVGDVAARAGVKVQEADEALKALAYDSKATLEVGEQGDVVYTFPRDFQASVRARSVLLSVLPALRVLGSAAAYTARAAFGVALVASVMLVWAAIAVIMTSGRRDDRQSGGGGRAYYGGDTGYYNGMRVYFNLADLFTFWDPSFGRSNYAHVAQGKQLSFVESIFSFVWGDGDPNADYDAKRWAALGRLIQSRGGVVTAEEMAPFLDPPERPEPSQQGAFKDESFVLPALIRFGGEPVVDPDTGLLLYKFPALQASAVTSEWVRNNGQEGGSSSGSGNSWGTRGQGNGARSVFGSMWQGRSGRQPESPAPESSAPLSFAAGQEQPWELTAASPASVMGVVALGLFNLVGVLTLQGMLRDPHAAYALAEWGLGWVGQAIPALQLYASTFFAVPLIRALVNAWRNAGVSSRNESRQQAARVLQEGAGGWLSKKLQAARQAGTVRTVRKGDVVFSTAQDVGQQVNERELRDWDRQMERSASGSAPGTRRGPAHPPAGQRRDFDGGWE